MQNHFSLVDARLKTLLSSLLLKVPVIATAWVRETFNCRARLANNFVFRRKADCLTFSLSSFSFLKLRCNDNEIVSKTVSMSIKKESELFEGVCFYF